MYLIRTRSRSLCWVFSRDKRHNQYWDHPFSYSVIHIRLLLTDCSSLCCSTWRCGCMPSADRTWSRCDCSGTYSVWYILWMEFYSHRTHCAEEWMEIWTQSYTIQVHTFGDCGIPSEDSLYSLTDSHNNQSNSCARPMSFIKWWKSTWSLL
jgi:hypothetical protein